ncbi:MAG: peptidoglycan DD-metalloendopeptidase family protein [Campylobacterales bacterium]|nr:peptidoglycan DD-metalloendopeptidase family protein [Campylobacterales bacterium]
MMRRIVLSWLVITLGLGAVSIDQKIEQKQKELSSTKVEYDKMDDKLSSVAKKILDAKSKQKKLDQKLATLEDRIKKSQGEYENLKEKQKEVEGELAKLTVDIAEKKEKFVALVADKFSMALALEEMDQQTSESVMLQEIYGVYAKENDRAITLLKEEIDKLKTKESYFTEKQADIQKTLKQYKQERDEYQEKKGQQNQLINELARDQAIYKKRFDKIRESRRSLQNKLSQLKIVKQNQQEEAKAKKEAQQRAVSESATQVASYTGGKTISPMSGSILIKKFGSYIDPIYKFKIFNKSITLKAPYKGSKVKSVLDGKIVFAEDSGGMLGKVVIIEHANRLHTIYAKLSRLAPGIHVGKPVGKGTVIGKVNSTLMFEVTKNNKHMNPLKLISL